MVLGKTNRRKALVAAAIIVITAIAAVGAVTYFALKWANKDDAPEQLVEEITDGENEPVEEEPVLPERIDSQPVVDEWVAGVGGNKSVLIYDLMRDEVVGEYNTAEEYNTASLYKLFVVYEGYRRLQSGEWDANAAAGATGHTILECLDLAIRESNSPCAETLWGKIGYDELDEIVRNDFGITNSDIQSFRSNAEDIAKMMQIFYKHQEITNEDLLARMKDSFLNQPATTYDWRQGLPSGFALANVYNKVGWDYNPAGYWNVYHDAAIVEFPEAGRDFIVVVMTNQVPFQKIRDLGARLESEFSKY